MRNWLIISLLAGVAAAATFYDLVAPFYSGHLPSLAENMQDTGAVLTITRELLNGRILYEQIYTPYGPVPHSIYEVLALVFGNTPVTYTGFTTLLSAVVLALAYILVRRFLEPSIALLFYILVIAHFGHFEIVYAACEVIGILLLAILWVPPEQRHPVRCVLYGVILCFIHFSKFGSDVVAAATFLLLDLLYLWRSAAKLDVLLSILKGGVLIGISFFALFTLAAWPMICRLAPDVAKDTLWPLYMGQSYNRFTGADRYPHYLGILYFTKIHFPMLLGIVACLASIAMLVLGKNLAIERTETAGQKKSVFPYPLLLPPLFFVLACFILLRHAWHYNQYGIYAAMGAALALCVFGVTARRVTILALVPYFFVASWAWVKGPLGIRLPPPLVQMNTPAGYTLEGAPDLVAFYQRLFVSMDEQIARTGTTQSIVVLSDRPGIYFFSGRGVAGRITWYLPTYVRPWEQASEEEALTRAGAIVLGVPDSPKTESHLEPDDITRALGVVYSPALTEFLLKRLIHPTFIGVDPSQPTVAVWTFALSSTESASQKIRTTTGSILCYSKPGSF